MSGRQSVQNTMQNKVVPNLMNGLKQPTNQPTNQPTKQTSNHTHKTNKQNKNFYKKDALFRFYQVLFFVDVDLFAVFNYTVLFYW